MHSRFLQIALSLSLGLLAQMPLVSGGGQVAHGIEVRTTEEEGVWHPVAFHEPFVGDAPLVFLENQGGGTQAPTIEIRNITLEGFEYRFSGIASSVPDEALVRIGFLAATVGEYSFGGLEWKAGTALVSVANPAVAFTAPFNLAPVVIARAALEPGTAAVLDNSDTGGFSLDFDFGATQPPQTVKVNFVAVEIGSGVSNGRALSTGRFALPEAGATPVFGRACAQPVVFASTQTNVASVHLRAGEVLADALGFEVPLEKLDGQAPPTGSSEEAGYIALAMGIDDGNESDLKLEIGEFPEPGGDPSDWIVLNFTETYRDPVVILSPLPDGDALQPSARIRNVSGTGCEVQVGSIASGEAGYWMVMESGSFTVGGRRWQAGAMVAGEDALNSRFALSFSSSPVLLAQAVGIEVGSSWVRPHQINEDEISLTLEGNPAATSAMVYYLALEPGRGEFGDSAGLKFESKVLAPGRIGGTAWRRIRFSETFAAPYFFAHVQDDPDGVHPDAKHRDLTERRIDLRLEEDEVDDIPRRIGLLLFGDTKDRDFDDMPDLWEEKYSLNPDSPHDAALNPDDDGLSNLEEYLLGTHPRLSDSDDDGIEDHLEADSSLEFDPNEPDSDGDGLEDGVEWRIIQASPFDGYVDQDDVDPLGDFDGDGIGNLAEASTQGDPLDYYNGQEPTLQAIMPPGAPPFAPASGWLHHPIHLLVTGSGSDPLPNAPVRFAVTGGGGRIAVASNNAATAPVATELLLRTDAQGIVKVDWKMGPEAKAVQTLLAYTEVAGKLQQRIIVAHSLESGVAWDLGSHSHYSAGRGVDVVGGAAVGWNSAGGSHNTPFAAAGSPPNYISPSLGDWRPWVQFDGTEFFQAAQGLPTDSSVFFVLVPDASSGWQAAPAPGLTSQNEATRGLADGNRYLLSGSPPATGLSPYFIHDPGPVPQAVYDCMSYYIHKKLLANDHYNGLGLATQTRPNFPASLRFDATDEARDNPLQNNVLRHRDRDLAAAIQRFKNEKKSGAYTWQNFDTLGMMNYVDGGVVIFSENKVRFQRYYDAPPAWQFDPTKIGSIAPALSVGTDGAGYFELQPSYSPQLGGWAAPIEGFSGQGNIVAFVLPANRAGSLGYSGASGAPGHAAAGGNILPWTNLGALPIGIQGFSGKLGEMVVIPGSATAAQISHAEDRLAAHYRLSVPNRDGDGRPDWWARFLIGASGEDSDGLDLTAEWAAGTHPGLSDSDGDGIPDDQESGAYALQPDSDGDGIADGQDDFPLDPTNGLVDTDGNGLADGLDRILEALGRDRFIDSDGDGVSDHAEREVINYDSGDNKTSHADVRPGDDFDGDGVSNYHESLDGTSLIDAADYFLPIAFDRLFGSNYGVEWTVETAGGIESSRLVRTAQGGPAGGVSHHEARHRTRMRFQFLPLGPGTTGDQVSIGFSHRGLGRDMPGDVADYAIAVHRNGEGETVARVLFDGTAVPGLSPFPVSPSDLLELRLDITGATPRMHVEMNHAPLLSVDLPPSFPTIDLVEHPLAVVAAVDPPSSGFRLLRYRAVSDPDSDGDGLFDRWEQLIVDAKPEYSDITQVLPNIDDDGDGLINSVEHSIGTKGHLSDTDNDQLSDGWEYKFGFDPTESNPDPAHTHSDGDGLSDLQEHDYYAAGILLDPTLDNTDEDIDGSIPDDHLDDAIEVALIEYDPEDGFATLVDVDDGGDVDGDGVENYREITEGTSPIEPNDFFAPVRFDGLGIAKNAIATEVSESGVSATALHRSATVPGGEISGALAHGRLGNGSRVRFRFSDPSKETVVGIALVDPATPYHSGAVRPPEFYAAVSNSVSGELEIASTFDAGVALGSAVSVQANDMFELKIESSAPTPHIVLMMNGAPLAEIPFPAGDVPADGEMLLAVELRETGAAMESARYCKVIDYDTDHDGMNDAWETFYNIHDPYISDDGDLLTNYEEYLAGTDPTREDSDNDGLPDDIELAIITRNPLFNESPGWDRIADPEGYTEGIDSDGDGMFDFWEYANGLDPNNLADAAYNPDNDGLTNIEEFNARTKPGLDDTDGDWLPDGIEVAITTRNPLFNESPAWDRNADPEGYTEGIDSDGDGMFDFWEYDNGLDPNNLADATGNPDNDGLTNVEEFNARTKPRLEDTDEDGMPDGWEVEHGLDPRNPNDAVRDDDYDKVTNLEEYQNGTSLTLSWTWIPIDDPGDNVPASNPSRFGLAPLIVGTLNDLGQVAKVEYESPDLVLRIWDGSWSPAIGQPGVSLGAADGFTEIQEVRMNNLGLVAAIVNDPILEVSEIRVIDPSGIVHRLGQGEGWKAANFLTVTDSGYVSGEVIESISPTVRKSLRWNDGSLDLVSPPPSLALRPGISESGVVVSYNSAFRHGFWQSQGYGEIVAISPSGQVWGTNSAFPQFDRNLHIFERNGYRLRSPRVDSEFDYPRFPSGSVSIQVSNGTTYAIADPMLNSNQTIADFTHAVDVNSRGDVVGWLVRQATEVSGFNSRAFHWKDGQFQYLQPVLDGLRYYQINESGQILAKKTTVVQGQGVSTTVDEWGMVAPDNDSNGDRLPDDWVVARAVAGPAGGNDDAAEGDTLSNRQEFALGTNPLSSDSDGDSIADHIEVRGGSSPSQRSSTPADHPVSGEFLHLESRVISRTSGTRFKFPNDNYFGTQQSSHTGHFDQTTFVLPLISDIVPFIDETAISDPNEKWPNTALWTPAELWGSDPLTPLYPVGYHRNPSIRLGSGRFDPFNAYTALSFLMQGPGTSGPWNEGFKQVVEVRLVNKELGDTSTETGGYRALTEAVSRRFLKIHCRFPIENYGEFDLLSPDDFPVYGSLDVALNHPDVEIVSSEMITLTIPEGQSMSTPDNSPPTAAGLLQAPLEDGFQHYVGLLPMEMRVDFDRDGADDILGDAGDSIPTDKRFRFWINDDRDSGEGYQATDINPENGNVDSQDSVVSNQRDLEDFTRLHVDLSCVKDLIESRDIEIGLKMTGQGSIGVHYAVDEEAGSESYLFERGEAITQAESLNYNTRIMTVGASESWFPNSGIGGRTTGLDPSHSLPLYINSNGHLHLIFEGITEGEGEIVLILKPKNGETIEGPSVPLKLLPVAKMFEHWTASPSNQPSNSVVGDRNTMTDAINAIPEYPSKTTDSGAFEPDGPEDDDVIVFVHGWRMEPWNQTSFGETSFKRLWHTGFRGKFFNFSWPTGFTPRLPIPLGPPADFDNYADSEEIAYHVGAKPLKNFLDYLQSKYPGRVYMFAHSMGGVASTTALKYGGQVETYAACQTAMVGHAYDPQFESRTPWLINWETPEVYAAYPPTGAEYFESIAQKIFNFYNRDDNALDSWEYGQNLKPNESEFYACDGFNQSSNGGNFLYISHLPLTYPPLPLTFPWDTFEIYAHCAEGRSYAIGARELPGAKGNFDVGREFSESAFNFTLEPEDHSAQWNGTMMIRHEFWKTLLRDAFGLRSSKEDE